MENEKNIKALQGETLVVKIGSLTESVFGNAYVAGVLGDVKFLQGMGLDPVVVHGGGKEVSVVMKSKGMEPIFFRGSRVTDCGALEVLREVMPRIGTAIADSMGEKAEHVVGYNGLLRVEPAEPVYGYVGNVVEVNVGLLHCMMETGAIPVVTPLGFDDTQVYNINGDMAASAVAVGLKAARLVFVTGIDGVMDGQNLLREVNGSAYGEMLAEQPHKRRDGAKGERGTVRGEQRGWKSQHNKRHEGPRAAPRDPER